MSFAHRRWLGAQVPRADRFRLNALCKLESEADGINHAIPELYMQPVFYVFKSPRSAVLDYCREHRALWPLNTWEGSLCSLACG